FPDLREIFVGLFQIPQLISLGAPSLIPSIAVELLLKPLRRIFRLPTARLHLFDSWGVRNRMPALKEKLQCRGLSRFANNAGSQSGKNEEWNGQREIYER